ncbi:MAG: archaeosortase/exosortase family protein [Cyclobacteriaceae bacterium]
MNEKIQKIIRRFLLRAVLIFLSWVGLYHGIIYPDGRVNDWLTDKVVIGTKVGLTFLGYNANQGFYQGTSRSISIDNQPVVLVADACNGLELLALFIGFLLAFPGPIRFKLVIIPLGTIVIFLLNIIREIVLALNYKYFQETFEFNHKYTYVFIVYVSIFLIWRFWLNRYSSVGKYVANV